MTVYSVPAESPFGLFGTSEQTDLDFWNGGDLNSQSNDFAVGSADTGTSGVDSKSLDPFNIDTTPFGENNPILAYLDSDTLAQDRGNAQDGLGVSCGLASRDLGSFDSLISIGDLPFGDILSDGEHSCPLGKVAACCVNDRAESLRGPIRVRYGCLWWRKFIL